LSVKTPVFITALLETRPIRHVYPTLSAQQHGGLGHRPDCIIAS